jgi:hypothetical protein
MNHDPTSLCSTRLRFIDARPTATGAEGSSERERAAIQARANAAIGDVNQIRTCRFYLQAVRGSVAMRDFANASFSPETIEAMNRAMESAVSGLPEPVSSVHVKTIAESILRTAREGERDPATLQRLALLELAITPRE